MDPLQEYQWIVVFGAIAAIFTAFGIGANDVANAYATSVGSKALTIKQACFLAVIFEFAGAVLAGSSVAETIRKGTADYKCYSQTYMDQAILMYGNLCVVGAVGMWLLIATKFEMPVSTTHSCVGGLIGMAIASKGPACVTWYKDPDPESAKYLPGGITGIVLSWVFSPLLSGIFAVALFAVVRCVVLRSQNSFMRAIKFYPVLIWLAVWINTFFIISKGVSKKVCPSKTNIWICSGYDSDLKEGAETDAAGDKLSKSDYPGKVNGWAALGFSCGVGLFFALALIPLYLAIKKRVEAEFADKDTEAGEAEEAKEDAKPPPEPPTTFFGKAKAAISYSLNRNVHDVKKEETDGVITAIHDNAEKFDPKTEAVFKYIQIFTAICDSFAHGANDVANAMGPFMSIWTVYTNIDTFEFGKGAQKTALDNNDQYWILALGGIGIGLGLLLYGYQIIQAIGVKLAVITPSRGFAIELGAAIVIIIGSYLGIPLSTTHCQVGATTGVALLEGGRGVNKWILGKTAFGWIITLIIAGILAGILTGQGIRAPLGGAINIAGCSPRVWTDDHPSEWCDTTDPTCDYEGTLPDPNCYIDSPQYIFLDRECPTFIANGPPAPPPPPPLS
mmetsp:Transcript_4410/g.13973  ORF Transcript_4410/g.13973 Transcript_4410/m.13973 type:complete len:617 (+) Transcript_4410:60-1910(+)